MKKEFLFDKSDIKIYHDYLSKESRKHSLSSEELLFNSHMHPRGIKELIEPKPIRLAKSVLFLLHTLESDKTDDRLQALHSLRDEVLFCAESTMTKNTARVLLAVMKDFVREQEQCRKLELLHTFNSLISGKPLLIRRALRTYNLLEMPEEWNQIAFDYHVHDSYTKGRKTPTHLIMDAWIKGIRKLTVIYYNLVPPEAARELLTAAAYMQITVHIGIEFTVHHKNKSVNLIWQPINLPDTKSYLDFLNKPEVKNFSQMAEQVTKYRNQIMFAMMNRFNKDILDKFNKYYHISLPVLKKKDFIEYTGNPPVSVIHLSEFIYSQAYPILTARMEKLEAEAASNPEKASELTLYRKRIQTFSSECIYDTWLKQLETVPDSSYDPPALPEIMQYTPDRLISVLQTLTPDYLTTLNLTGLTATDILELLYDCKGEIHNLEIYNYKNFAHNSMPDLVTIRKLEQYINEKDATSLKRLIKNEFLSVKDKNYTPDDRKRLTHILMNINKLFDFYRVKQLHDRWGSDSTGQSKKLYGMGFALLETLPRGAQKEVMKKRSLRLLPVHIRTTYRKTYALRPIQSSSLLPFRFRLHRKSTEWIAGKNSDDNTKLNNLVALGDRVQKADYFPADEKNKGKKKKSVSYYWTYMPTGLKNVIKVTIGFVPAFMTFYLTKDWWVLMYLGAPIWFAITGIRNIIQAVLGGDSIYRSPLLRWTHYVDWSRIADSLLYSGFSVPIQDYLVKTVLLDRYCSITLSNNPFMVYAVMSLANGIYISAHNILRGFPKITVTANFFRSAMAIPVAFFCSSAIGSMLSAGGIPAVDEILQKWAAVISKASSDFVGGFIEGISNREHNIRLRKQDYTRKFEQMQQTCSQLELVYPQKSIQKVLKQPRTLILDLENKNSNLLKICVCDALDFFYFWMYQPYARTVLKRKLACMPRRTRYTFLLFQNILKDQRLISTLLVKGIIGINFEKALALYLNHSKFYLKAINRLIAKEQQSIFRQIKEQGIRPLRTSPEKSPGIRLEYKVMPELPET